MIQIAYFSSDTPKITAMAATEITDCYRYDSSGAKEFARIVKDIDEPEYKKGTITMKDGTKVTTRADYMAHLDKHIPA